MTNWVATWANPLFSAPTRFSAGTRTSAYDSSAVSEQCQPILSSLRVTVNPGVPRSTTSSDSPCAPGSPVRTTVVTKSARQPEVMKVFAPLTT